MGELQVRANGQLVVLMEGERLGFGRGNTDPGGSKGWDYRGRFVELSTRPHVHRVWGEVVSESGMWKVRSLGSLHPVVVVPAGQRPIELPPTPTGAAPSEFVVTQESFDVVLTVAADTFRLSCAVVGPRVAAAASTPGAGEHTVTLRVEMADRVTATEFPVLWTMAKEYRQLPPAAAPQPLSYSRVCRALELTEKQAISAVNRAVTRFRSAQLMPDSVAATEQRDWLCRQLVAHEVFDELARRHGAPPEP